MKEKEKRVTRRSKSGYYEEILTPAERMWLRELQRLRQFVGVMGDPESLNQDEPDRPPHKEAA